VHTGHDVRTARGVNVEAEEKLESKLAKVVKTELKVGHEQFWKT
jgi:hypothetical protein